MTKVTPRPKELQGQTYMVNTGCGHLYVTVNFHVGMPFEVFAKLGKSGNCPACFLEALSRSISIGLRAGIPLSEYHDHLINIQCNSPTYSDGKAVKSCPDAIASVLLSFAEVKE